MVSNQKKMLYLHPQHESIAMFMTHNAKIAQLVERHLAKVEVASSSLVFRSENNFTLYFTDNHRDYII